MSAFGLVFGLCIMSALYFWFGYKGYYKISDSRPECVIMGISLGIYIFITVIIMFLALMDSVPNKLWIYALCSLLVPLIFTVYTLYSSNGKYVRILNKIDKIERNLNKISYTEDKTIIEAKEILYKTLKELKTQANSILINDSIKIVKNIERNNKKINIQKEIDTLDALNILKKR